MEEKGHEIGQDAFDRLVGRFTHEPEYRNLVLTNAEQALKQVGVANPTPQQIKALEDAVGHLNKVSTEVEKLGNLGVTPA